MTEPYVNTSVALRARPLLDIMAAHPRGKDGDIELGENDALEFYWSCNTRHLKVRVGLSDDSSYTFVHQHEVREDRTRGAGFLDAVAEALDWVYEQPPVA